MPQPSEAQFRIAPQAGSPEDIAWSDHRIRFFTERVSGKRVLDVGCVEHDPLNYRSPHWVHKALLRVAAHVIGIDCDERGVSYLRDKGFNIQLADARDFDLGETFDVVVAGDVMEHIDNPGGFLDSCRRHLAPGGVVLVTTPNPWFWKYIVRATVFGRVKNNIEHVCWFDPVLLGQLAKRHGFTLCEKDIEFGARDWYIRMLPLPRLLKYTTFHAVLRRD